MKWRKLGRLYVPTRRNDWMVSHAQLPIVDRLDEDRLRVYFGTRNDHNHTVTSYIEVAADDPKDVLYVNDQNPLIDLGELGCFDDTGVLPSWVVDQHDNKYLYYIGWNAGVSVSYRNSIGVAVSDDGGASFVRKYRGPVMDRTRSEPQFCSAPCVLIEDGVWKMWYLSALRWELIDGRPEPIYHIKYAQSDDGFHWRREGVVAIDLKSADEGGITRPCVFKENGTYKMFYSYRGRRDYRTNPKHSYRIGYAESPDGVHWQRLDANAGIDVSADGWDSKMVAFAYVYWHKSDLFMMYNGNGFGETGIGYAIREA